MAPPTTSRGRVLHLLSQRPSLTGSGVTLDALVRHGRRTGWEQAAVVGVPAADPRPAVGGLSSEAISTVIFDAEPLPFPLPGMSDVMPYPSSRFSTLTADQRSRYRSAWSGAISAAVARFHPQVIHTHHLWLMSALVRAAAPGIPLVAHCHATGLRQLELCPHLAQEVIAGCRELDHICALHQGNRQQICEALGVPTGRVSVVGAGYREDIFGAEVPSEERSGRILYAGKLSRAKGLPWLLEAFGLLTARRPGIELHLAGGGASAESDELRRTIEGMGPRVITHGHVDQRGLARLMQRCAVFVLPSLYEGLPLVLVEALACGCRLVATELPGVVTELAPLGPFMERVPLPRLTGVDSPVAADLPGFVTAIAHGLEAALDRGALDRLDPARSAALVPFGWGAVFERVQQQWRAADLNLCVAR